MVVPFEGEVYVIACLLQLAIGEFTAILGQAVGSQQSDLRSIAQSATGSGRGATCRHECIVAKWNGSAVLGVVVGPTISVAPVTRDLAAVQAGAGAGAGVEQEL